MQVSQISREAAVGSPIPPCGVGPKPQTLGLRVLGLRCSLPFLPYPSFSLLFLALAPALAPTLALGLTLALTLSPEASSGRPQRPPRGGRRGLIGGAAASP